MHRRGFLSLCAAGSMAGCSVFGSPNHEAARADATAITDTSEEPYRQRLALEFEVPVGEYTFTELSPSETETLALEVTVNRGVLDVFTFTSEEFTAYEEAEELRAIEELSTTGVIGGASLVGEIDPGDHRIVLDNTPTFGADPDGAVVGDARYIRRLMPDAFFEFRATLNADDIAHDGVGASEDRTWWLVRYERGDDETQLEVGVAMQDLLLAYSEVVPARDEAPDHRGLRIAVVLPDADPVIVQAAASLARRHSQGELDDQEYFEEVQRTTQ